MQLGTACIGEEYIWQDQPFGFCCLLAWPRDIEYRPNQVANDPTPPKAPPRTNQLYGIIICTVLCFTISLRTLFLEFQSCRSAICKALASVRSCGSTITRSLFSFLRTLLYRILGSPFCLSFTRPSAARAPSGSSPSTSVKTTRASGVGTMSVTGWYCEGCTIIVSCLSRIFGRCQTGLESDGADSRGLSEDLICDGADS